METLSKQAYSGKPRLYKALNTMVTQPILLIFNLSILSKMYVILYVVINVK